MSRTLGARNAQFVERRNALIARAKDRLALQTGNSPSFRELALACGVSVATLRHYFGSRDALIKAVFAHYLQGGQRHLERTREALADTVTFEFSLHEFLTRVVKAWSGDTVGLLHRIGLAEGLRKDRATALDYLVDVLEPTLQALEQRLRRARHARRHARR
jgi:AcrR family transcriptional regulator